jgi:hypothetical protein
MAKALTPKQVQQLAFEQINALCAISKHVGLIAPCEALAIREEEIARRVEKYGVTLVYNSVFILLDEGSSAIQKAAAGLLLECFFPKWKDHFPKSVTGQVVDRNAREVREWRRSVLSASGGKCTQCGSVDNLHAHHIVRWVDAPILRLIPENGTALCERCHVDLHHA